MTSTRFEDRLLAELRAVVAANPEPAVRRRRARAPRRLLAAAAAAGVAAVAAVVVAAGGDHTAPAFAVDRQADGDVSVTINRLSDAGGLERELRAAGVPAVVDYTPPGMTCRQPRGGAPAPGDGRSSTSSLSHGGGQAVTFSITRGMVGPGQTLVVMTSGGDDNGPTSVGLQVVQGHVSPCELVKAPGVPAPSATTGSGERSLHTGP